MWTAGRVSRSAKALRYPSTLLTVPCIPRVGHWEASEILHYISQCKGQSSRERVESGRQIQAQQFRKLQVLQKSLRIFRANLLDQPCLQKLKLSRELTSARLRQGPYQSQHAGPRHIFGCRLLHRKDLENVASGYLCLPNTTLNFAGKRAGLVFL